MGKKDEILMVAIRLFAENGYHGTSMRMIAENAGVVPSSIYNHYKSKEAIILEIAKLMRGEIEGTFDLAGGCNKVDKLEIYKKNIIRSVMEKPEFWRLIHSIRMNTRVMEIVKDEMESLQQMVSGYILSILSDRHGHPVMEEVLIFWATIDGVVAASLLIENYPLENVLTKFFQKCCIGG